MPVRTLGLIGFETGHLDMEGIARVSGTGGVFNTSVLPAGGSVRSFEMDGGASVFTRKFHNGETAAGTAMTPNGTRWAFGFQMRPTSMSSASEGRFGVSTGSTERIMVAREDTTGYVTLRVNGTVVATSTYVAPLNTWTRYIVDVDNDTAGYVRVYVAGNLNTPIIDYTLASAVTDPDSFKFEDNGAVTHYLDDMWAIDLDGQLDSVLSKYISVAVLPSVPSGAGHYSTWGNGSDGVGIASAIDEIPYNDTDYIDARYEDEASTFDWSAVAGDNVLAVQLHARVLRTGSTAGEHMVFRQRLGSTDLDGALMDAPGDGFCIQVLDGDANGDDYTAANFAATEFGVVSRT